MIHLNFVEEKIHVNLAKILGNMNMSQNVL